MALLKSLSALLLLSAVATAQIGIASAEEISVQDVQQKLKPKKLTRSLKPDPTAQQLDDILSRSIGVVERKKIVELTEKAELPRLDFSISFGYDSADIDSKSFMTLDTLAEAFQSGDLNKSRFLVNGHTDAKGSDDYNLDLSQRRADAVVAYLVSRHDIAPERLKALGFGESALKDSNDGESAANRRVEIINRP